MPKSKNRKSHSKSVMKRNQSLIHRNRKIKSQEKVMSEIDHQARIDALNGLLLEQLENHDNGTVIIEDKEYLEKLTEFAESLKNKDVTKVEV